MAELAARRPPYVVGLTGGIGSGKSAAAEEFARLGIDVIDSDAIAHELTAPGGAAIPGLRRLFGEQAIDERGALDRAAMRSLVFADPQARTRLEAFLHPLIRCESARRLERASSPYAVYMVPLLVEAQPDYRTRYDRVAVVDCPEEIQISRVMQRSGMSEDDVRRIMAAQATRAARLAAADDVLDNSGTLDALHLQVRALHARYLKFATERELRL